MKDPWLPLSPSLMDEAFSFKAGLTLRVGGTVFHLDEVVEEGKVQRFKLRHHETNEIRHTTSADFAKLKPGIDYYVLSDAQEGQSLAQILASSDWQRKFLRRLPLSGKSLEQVHETVRRIKWLDAIHRLGYHNFTARQLWVPDVIRIAKENNWPLVGKDTLVRWESLAREGGGRAIIPRYDLRGGPGRSRVDGRAEDFLGEAIVEARKNLASLTIGTVNSLMTDRINLKNAELVQCAENGKGVVLIGTPSLSTVTRRFNEMVSPYERDVQRYGRRAADRMHHATAAQVQTGVVGGITQCDDVDSNAFAIDKRTGLPWGRPQITQCADQESGYPVGYAFGVLPRSAVSAVEALVHSIEPKRINLVDEHGNPLCWDAFGYPTQALLDNALYNNERIISLGADVLDPTWARPRTPTDKPVVEFQNREVKHGFLRKQPGWRGLKGDPDAIKEGLATAVFSTELLREGYLRWLLGDFANKPMEDGFTRREKYLEVGRISFRPRLPPDVRRLRLLKMVRLPNLCTWTRSGLTALGLNFQDVELYEAYVRTAGGNLKMSVRFDPDDLMSVWVDIPGTDLAIQLPCTSPDYVQGLTYYQHKLILKICYQNRIRHPSLAQYHATRHQLFVMTQQWLLSDKISERKRGVRVGEVKGSTRGKTITEVVHDIERGCDELDAVTMDESAEGWELPDAD